MFDKIMAPKASFILVSVIFIVFVLVGCSNQEEVAQESTIANSELSTTKNNSEEKTLRTVSSAELINAVKKMIEEDYYEGVANRVEFDGENLYIVYDYTQRYAGTSILSDDENNNVFIMETDSDDLANYILEMGEEYTNTWKTITIDCGDYGTATFDKSMIVNHGYGDYFDYIEGELLK